MVQKIELKKKFISIKAIINGIIVNTSLFPRLHAMEIKELTCKISG